MSPHPGPMEPTHHGHPRRLHARLSIALLAASLTFAVTEDASAQSSAPASNPAARAGAERTPLEELLANARRLMRGGEHRAAYELLDARSAAYAGNGEFDYLLGIAALESGLPGHAILAFERVLAVSPGHLQARAELGRAYLAANEREAAREQFEQVASQRIPPEVARTIDRYLAGIAQAQADEGVHFSGFAELGLGYDSNVNFGSASNQWLLADGTAVTPAPVSQPRESAVWQASLGAVADGPIGGGWKWTIGGTLTHRSSPSVHIMDQQQVDVAAGLQYRGGCHSASLQAQAQHLRLDEAAFRNAIGTSAQWRCDLDARTQIGGFVQGFEFTFPGQDVRNARRVTLGATFARLLSDGHGKPILIGSVYVGKETPRQDVPQLEYRLHGARAALSISLGASWQGFGSLSWEARDYRGVEPLFGATREDRQTDIRLGAERNLSGSWAISPQLIATRNASTLAPSDFRRLQAMVFTRYRF